MKNIVIFLIFIILFSNNLFPSDSSVYDDETVKLLGGLQNCNLLLNIHNALVILGLELDLSKTMEAFAGNINNCRDKKNKITSIENFVSAILIKHEIKNKIKIKYLKSQNELTPGDVALLLYSDEPYSAIEYYQDGTWCLFNTIDLKLKSDVKIRKILLFSIEE